MTKREIIIAIAAVVLVVFLAAMWQHERELAIRADDARQSGDARFKAIQDQIATTNQALAEKLKSLDAQRQTPATPQQIVIDASRLIPNLPQPLVAAPTAMAAPSHPSAGGAPADPATQSPAPDAAGVIIPHADLQAVRDYSITCQENEARLGACQTNLAASGEQIKTVERERDAEHAARKGGTFLQRLGHKAKCLAISGGASALGAWADKSQPARGALIGATVGGVGCEIF